MTRLAIQVTTMLLLAPPLLAQETVDHSTTTGGGGTSTGDHILQSVVGLPLLSIQSTGDHIHSANFLRPLATPSVVLSDLTLLLGKTSAISFEGKLPGETGTLTIEIVNDREEPVQITGVEIDQALFQVLPSEFSLEPGIGQQIRITYADIQEGRVEGTLTINSDAADASVTTVSIAAASAQAAIAFTESEFTFGDPVLLNTTVARRITVDNVGTEPLLITSITSSSDLFEPDRSILTVGAGQRTFLLVAFTPVEEGEQNPILTLESNDPDFPSRQITLFAAGVVPAESSVFVDFLSLDDDDGDQGQRELGPAKIGSVYPAQLVIRESGLIGGWDVTIVYDPTKVAYVKDSFRSSEFLPGLLEFVADDAGRLTVGGSQLAGSQPNNGSAILGTLQFEILGEFDGTAQLDVREVGLNLVEGGLVRTIVQAVATFRAERVAGPIPGDFNADGIVSFDDFFMFADAFASEEAYFDLDGDGVVAFADLFKFSDNWLVRAPTLGGR